MLNAPKDSQYPESLGYILTTNNVYIYRRRPLHLAVLRNHISIVNAILKAVKESTDPELLESILMTTDMYGDTPLQAAFKNGHTGIIKIIQNAIEEKKYYE